MSFENILLEKDNADKRIAWLTLNRPEKLNALSSATLKEIFEAVDEVDHDDDIVVLILKGAGKSFSSGYDLQPASARGASSSQLPQLGQGRRNLIATVEKYLRLWNFRKPTIAMVHGYCLSGATELIAMCDIVIASEDAKFAHTAGRDMGCLRTNGLYPYLMGMRKTKEYLFTGDFIDGKTAEKWGLINKAVPHDILEEEAYDMARRIVRIPLEILSYHKATTNHAYEVMGIHTYLLDGCHFAASASAEIGAAFLQKAKEKGVKEVFDQRDIPWKQYKRVSLPKKPRA